MKKIKLGDCATFINGYAFKPSDWKKTGTPIVRIQDLTGSIQNPNFYDGNLDEKYMIDNGDILISWSGSLGIYEWNKGKAYLNQHIFKVKFDKIEFNKRYFVYLVKSKINEMLKNVHGSTMKHITKKNFDKIQIELHSLERQQEIAQKLDIIQEITDIRKKQIEELDEIIKSQFVEMFGSVELNDKKFEEQEMSCISDISSSKRIYANEYQEIGIPFYRSKEIIELGHNKKPSIELFISKSRYEEIKDKYGIPKKGDILITAVGTIGETWIVDTDEPFYYKDGNVLQIRLNTDISQIYFKYVLDTLISIFKNKNVSGSAYSALTIEKFKKMKIILPPIELQDKFAEIVRQIDKQKFEIQKNLEEMQKLQESLMNKYFG